VSEAELIVTLILIDSFGKPLPVDLTRTGRLRVAFRKGTWRNDIVALSIGMIGIAFRAEMSKAVETLPPLPPHVAAYMSVCDFSILCLCISQIRCIRKTAAKNNSRHG
jgi:hypothetical protein